MAEFNLQFPAPEGLPVDCTISAVGVRPFYAADGSVESATLEVEIAPVDPTYAPGAYLIGMRFGARVFKSRLTAILRAAYTATPQAFPGLQIVGGYDDTLDYGATADNLRPVLVGRRVVASFVQDVDPITGDTESKVDSVGPGVKAGGQSTATGARTAAQRRAARRSSGQGKP